MFYPGEKIGLKTDNYFEIYEFLFLYCSILGLFANYLVSLCKIMKVTVYRRKQDACDFPVDISNLILARS